MVLPTDNLMLHFDPSNPAGVVGDPVETLVDLSGNGSDATQASVWYRPPLIKFNGLNWLDFSAGAFNLLTSESPPIPTERTIFVVLYLPYDEHTSGTRYVFAAYPEIRAGVVGISIASLAWGYIHDTEGRSTLSNEEAPLREVYVFSVDWQNDSVIRCFVNGVLQDQQIAIGTAIQDLQHGWSIGSRGDREVPYNGFLGEVLTYDRKLEDWERSDVNTHLNQKWRFPSFNSIHKAPLVEKYLLNAKWGPKKFQSLHIAVPMPYERMVIPTPAVPTLKIALVESISHNQVMVTFDRAVVNNIALRNPLNYVVTPTLKIYQIEIISPTQVKLTTEEQLDEQEYTLEVKTVRAAF